MVCLLNKAGAKDILLGISENDEDPSVGEFAKAMLYRLTVAERASAVVTPKKFKAYQENVRRMGAEALFKSKAADSDSDQ